MFDWVLDTPLRLESFELFEKKDILKNTKETFVG